MMKDHYYIDGYNFFHVFYARNRKALVNDDLEMARERVVNYLKEFSALSGSRVTIVFDGRKFKGEKDHRVSKDDTTVRVVYAPPNTDADSVIESYVYREHNKDRIYVVSSDLALRQTCLGMGVSVMKPENFMKYFSQILQSIQLHQRYSPSMLRVEMPLYEKLRVVLKDLEL